MTLEYIAFVKARLSEQFLRSDLDPLGCFLGIEVSSISDGSLISQEKYTHESMIFLLVLLLLMSALLRP